MKKATSEIHRSTAIAHFEFAEQLRIAGDSSPARVGWAVTALFYSCLHVTRGILLSNYSFAATTHKDAETRMQKTPEFAQRMTDYKFLSNASQAWRYYGKSYSWDDYDYMRKKAVLKFIRPFGGWPNPPSSEL